MLLLHLDTVRYRRQIHLLIPLRQQRRIDAKLLNLFAGEWNP